MGEKNDRLLLFATGGLAIGEAHSEGSVTVTVFGETDFLSGLAQQLRQLGDVRRDPPRLIACG
jgi:hypothetical protein